MYTQRGFSLIELMIVVAIVGIIASIAYPSYMNAIRESRRTEGRNALLNIELLQQKHRANNTTYGTTANILGAGTTTENGHYVLAISNNTATTYTATATAQNDQANDSENGTSCATLTVTVNGVSITRTPAVCW